MTSSDQISEITALIQRFSKLLLFFGDSLAGLAAHQFKLTGSGKTRSELDGKMVVFICGSCGESVKKAAVDKHCQTQCRNCASLSCIDCGKTFPGDSFRTHNACMTEEEKWHGKDYKAKDSSNSGKKKQDAWTESIQNAIASTRSSDPKLRMTLERLLTYDNVPRKESKFKNFVQNSMRVHDQRLISSIWDIVGKAKEAPAKPSRSVDSSTVFPGEPSQTIATGHKNSVTTSHDPNGDEDAPANKKLKTNGHADHFGVQQDQIEPSVLGEVLEESSSAQHSAKFKWKKAIKSVLSEADGSTLPEKKLRKKVIKSFETLSGTTDQPEDLREHANRKFDKFLKKYPDLFLLKDNMVTLVL